MINQYAIQYQEQIYCVEIDEEVSKVVLVIAVEASCFVPLETNQPLVEMALDYYNQGILTPIDRTWITKDKLISYSENAFKVWVESTTKLLILRNGYLLNKYETPLYDIKTEMGKEYYPHWSYYLVPRVSDYTATTVKYDGTWMSRAEAVDLVIAEWEALCSP